jgi:hypothetical protein
MNFQYNLCSRQRQASSASPWRHILMASESTSIFPQLRYFTVFSFSWNCAGLCLPECDAVWSGRCVSPFRMNFLPWTQEGALKGFESHHRQDIFFSKRSGPTVVPSLLFNGYRGYYRKWSGRWVMLTTHLHLVPVLRMSGAIPLLPLFVPMAGTGTLLFLLLVHIYQATRRHNLIHSSTRSTTPYLQIEIGGLNSPHKKCYFLRVGSGCGDVMGCWSLSLSLSHPPLLSMPQDLAPWMYLDLCQAHVKYQTCRPFSYFWHESKSCAVSAAGTDRTVPAVASKWPIISTLLVVGLYWNVQRHVGTYVILLTSTCFHYLGRNVPVIFTHDSFFYRKYVDFHIITYVIFDKSIGGKPRKETPNDIKNKHRLSRRRYMTVELGY